MSPFRLMLVLSLLLIGASSHGQQPCDLSLGPVLSQFDEVLAGGNLPQSYVRATNRQSQAGRSIQLAVVPEGQYKPGLDQELRQQGYVGVVIRNPSESAIVERSDFLLAPEWQLWIGRRPPSSQAWIESLSSDQRRKIRRTPEGVRSATAPLTVGQYRAWYNQFFAPEILSKDGALNAWPNPANAAEFTKRFGVSPDDDATLVPTFHYLSFTFADPASGTSVPIGGQLFQDGPDAGTKTRCLFMRAAAYSTAHKKMGISFAELGYAQQIDLAAQLNIDYISLGHDTNFYGLGPDVGLLRSKAGLGPTVLPGRFGALQLVKILDPTLEDLRTEANPSPTVFVFAIVDDPNGTRIEKVRRLAAGGASLEDQIRSAPALLSPILLHGRDTASPNRVSVPSGMALRIQQLP